jgi:hypothetical protein
MTVGETRVQVAAVRDLVVLKLMACRDQDLIDLLMLAHRCAPSAADILESASLDDVERRVSEGAMRARHERASGALVVTAEQALGRPPPEDAVDALGRCLARSSRRDCEVQSVRRLC